MRTVARWTDLMLCDQLDIERSNAGKWDSAVDRVAIRHAPYWMHKNYNPRHVPVIKNELVMVAEREVWGITMHSDIQHTSGYYTDVLWCDNRRGAYPRYEFAICLTPRL